MIPTFDEFARLSGQGYAYIPVVREILSDLETPLSLYLKLANCAYSYLLESVQGGETWGRYSIIGLAANEVIRVTGQQITYCVNDKVVETCTETDPLAWITRKIREDNVAPLAGLPRFYGGYVGYLGYDTVRYIEPRLGYPNKPDPIATPDILLLRSTDVAVIDNLAGKVYLITQAKAGSLEDYQQAQARLGSWMERLRSPVQHPGVTSDTDLSNEPWVLGFAQQDFEQAVTKAKTYINAGDIMQVVLSQRLSVPYHGLPINFYRALRTINPSPYLYYFHLGDFYIAGSSPEILVRATEEEVVVRPIAGTRPRGATPEEDLRLEQELLADPKELAEHIMLVDLGRNDVGRVAEIGSVHVDPYMVVERYSHVMHIVSQVQGRPHADIAAMDVLRATFPAGTLSGAPKVRAMEIIDELEPVKRGIYGGAIGYMGFDGHTDFAIAIRTAVIKDQTLHIQAGAGIVADSEPYKEWEETLNKARAIVKAVDYAQQGLDG